MAECSLAISFAPLFEGHSTDCVDGDHHSDFQEALPIHLSENPGRARCFVDCGTPLPEYEVEIRGDDGSVLPDRLSGSIFVRGPSVMSGYFNAPDETAAALSEDGWLNTGDVGYRVDGSLIVTGRKKDLIIINGRNIWPQDLEYLAEHQPEVRIGDALAFSVPNPKGDEICVLVVQCRESDPVKRSQPDRPFEPPGTSGTRHRRVCRAGAAAHAAAHLVGQAVAFQGAPELHRVA